MIQIRELQKAGSKEEIIFVTAKQLVRLLGRSIFFYVKDKDTLLEPECFLSTDSDDRSLYVNSNEKAAAAWVLHNNKRAGATTDTLSGSRCQYLAVRIGNTVYGVLGVSMDKGALEPFENSVLLSILGECAMALENEQISREKEQAAILAKNEQLRANILRAISHDLRTPLTSISGNAAVLLSNAEEIPEEKKKKLYTDIYDDAMWLINLVENLLAVTHIEGGTMSLRFKPELMDDVIDEALRHISRKKTEHHITFIRSDELALAKMDARLIVQVVINIVDNAIKYTPVGSDICIRTYVKDQQVVTEISDNGPGISDEAKPRIFDMFYTVSNKAVDSHRSIGLGLALCKSVMTAHGGTIMVEDNSPVGTVFRFALPVEEVKLHE